MTSSEALAASVPVGAMFTSLALDEEGPGFGAVDPLKAWGDFKLVPPAGSETGSFDLGTTRSNGLTEGRKPVRFRPGNPAVTGSLERRDVRKVVNHHKDEVRACFAAEYEKDDTLQGKTEVLFVIDAKGDVISAKVESNTIPGMAGVTVGTCLSHRVKSWRFPAPVGGGTVEVTYPFVFARSW